MKAVLFVIGLCAAAYTIVALVIFAQTLLSGDGGVRGIADIAAAILPPCLGAIVADSCFRRAFRKPVTPPDPPGPGG